jgi:hypothetical protein
MNSVANELMVDYFVTLCMNVLELLPHCYLYMKMDKLSLTLYIKAQLI